MSGNYVVNNKGECLIAKTKKFEACFVPHIKHKTMSSLFVDRSSRLCTNPSAGNIIFPQFRSVPFSPQRKHALIDSPDGWEIINGIVEKFTRKHADDRGMDC